MRRCELLTMLLEMARQGCARAPTAIDKALIALNLEVSAWTLNKWLKEAAEAGYVKAVISKRGKRYLLTEKAIAELNSLVTELNHAIGGITRLTLTGRIFRGLGEGGFYVSLAEYKEWFRRYLGFEPYPGTLNVRLDPDSAVKRKLLESYDGFRIPPTSRGDRSYCGARVFKAVVNDSVEAGVVIPEKTVYGPDVLEVIAGVCLRTALGLKDGDLVKVEVLLEKPVKEKPPAEEQVEAEL
jgi:Transcriptional regulator of a riboflavin/FAD biosynthetic operon